MAVETLNEDNFDDTVENNDMVVVDFWAPGCGPCQSVDTAFREVASRFPSVVFAQVNVADNPNLAQRLGVKSVPTILLFREQIILYKEHGAVPAGGLERVVHQAGQADMDQIRQDLEAQETQGDAPE
jgi:thioredoxin 1